ncbi:glycoside hydrolase family 27 protein [Anaerocolumna jejuensis]|uniref:glycoside hydrolase family 27 protein n=1 Tax=Anaerocolumna jejuensis TaxID=259063 RepID=UPI003F7C900B
MSILAKTPPMGWNTWNTFGWKINEELVKKAADAFVESGLKAAGYEYIVIDDCWSLKERDEGGRLVCDPEKFPGGMKQLADYVHSKGLKFGMYSCAGTHTCAGHPGSFEHEFEDAKTFAEWGVDYLKYDYCYKPDHIPGEILYKRMGTALRNCGRDILFSACNWGNDEVYQWIRETGAHMFRSTGDIQDNWESIKNIVLSQIGKESHSGTYCYNDMDMLVVGMYGKGDNNAVALGGCSDIEYRSHFSLWALMNSPLMIGCDIRKMSKETVEILTNKDIIALNQDEEARGPYCIRQWNNPEKVMAFVKPLSNGDYAIGMFNFSETASEMSLQFWDIGLSAAAGKGLSIYDCWSHEEEGTFKERYVCTIEPHGCRVFRGKVIDF